MREINKHCRIGIDGYKWYIVSGGRTSNGRRANKRYYRRVRRAEDRRIDTLGVKHLNE